MDAAAFGMGGTGDPYVWINHMGNKMKTKIVTMKLSDDQPDKGESFDPIEWNQEMLLPLELPLANDDLKF